MEQVNRVTASVVGFHDLMEDGGPKLALDDYQRSYVWGPEKVEQLIEDLREHSRQPGPALDYYMGALLIHEHQEKGRRFIVDGQQRLTSLCILHHKVHGRLPGGQSLAYRAPESASNIRMVRDRLRAVDLGEEEASLLDRVCFTVITVRDEDLAFTFFDTQNNRGVPLAATDLLKAYHLRAIGGAERRRLQESSARRWEHLQQIEKDRASGASDFAPTLFNQYLWRARQWTGQVDLRRESNETVLSEFQQGSVSPNDPAKVDIYPSHWNRSGETLALDSNDRCVIVKLLDSASRGPAELPFVIRQPIPRGMGFFLYAEKYAHIVAQLLYAKANDPEVNEFRRLHAQVIRVLSCYLRELFLLASVMYVDRFGTGKLFQFSLWLDHVVGAIRIKKQNVFREAPLLFLRTSRRNLLDVIAGAFRPEDIVGYLRADQDASSTYDKEDITGTGVQGRYKQALLLFYGQSVSLRGKATWIDKLVAERLR